MILLFKSPREMVHGFVSHKKRDFFNGLIGMNQMLDGVVHFQIPNHLRVGFAGNLFNIGRKKTGGIMEDLGRLTQGSGAVILLQVREDGNEVNIHIAAVKLIALVMDPQHVGEQDFQQTDIAVRSIVVILKLFQIDILGNLLNIIKTLGTARGENQKILLVPVCQDVLKKV